MIRIIIRRKAGLREPWHPFGEATAWAGVPVMLPHTTVTENDHLSFQFLLPGTDPCSLRLFVGSILIASTLPTDRVVPIEEADFDAGQPPLTCRGKFFADWAGLTELAVWLRRGDESEWHKILTIPVAVAAGKLTTEQFDRLFADLGRDAAAMLLDIHGKTQLGLKAGQPLSSAAPVAILGKVRTTVAELERLLHRLSRHPASRLRTTLTREQALPGQAISEATLTEVCRDPGLLVRVGGHLVFREHVAERSQFDFRISEHQTIADFAEYLKAQLTDLRQRIDLEVTERRERKRWRNAPRDQGQPTWWEMEDLPRIEELGRFRREIDRLNGAINKWAALPFLPPGRCLHRQPVSTPLFRNHGIYRRVFRVIATHFRQYQATLDPQPLLTRARSLPVLYEWWCAVRVLRILSRGLTPLPDPGGRSIIATRLGQEGKRFTLEFSWDQAINFTDGHGQRVRFRYQPEYLAARDDVAYAGVLSSSAVRTPDLAIEVFRSLTDELPDLILVLDAKYSSAPQLEKVAEVTTKYARIGDGRTGAVLSRQVWALTPQAPFGAERADGLGRYCTVDNRGFWSLHYDIRHPVNGAIQTRPVEPGAFDPLEALLARLLTLAGVRWNAG